MKKKKSAQLITFILATFLILAASSSEAAELKIPSCQILNILWKARYHRILKVDWPLQDIDCNRTGPNRDRVFAEAAYILDYTQIRVYPIPGNMYAPPRDMLGFVTSKYNKLSIGTGGSPYTDVDNKIVYFYPDVVNENGFSVIGNLIHESRHADGRQYLHGWCWSGPNQFQSMCDTGLGDRFDEGGPHRISTLYMAWAIARSNWPQSWKDTMRSLTEYIVNTRINAFPWVRNEWLSKYLYTPWN